ncbi:hypothetical protein EIN_181430 [Entamoeba invadens IP1]|uniref:hypothetical protein n=1 Tax=Entamoeba invadens IP1 TaxID=370355 RepID=UPI0002C3F763|nr:hypothetical protein EIN_181430 [Entamoeba invadens IP1]ELP93976.1 hypothetical protein EIN_181430 [Entamoeba invadens IP1]|eukprot:XP_004260747.1 hypothetical protein EIN_181430 [Entamoeba invadens IP1]
MKSIRDVTPFKLLNETIKTLISALVDSEKETESYISFLTTKNITDTEGKTLEESISHIESILSSVDEIVTRRNKVIEQNKLALTLLTTTQESITHMIDSCSNTEISTVEGTNELIKMLIDKESEKLDRDIKPLQQAITQRTEAFDARRRALQARMKFLVVGDSEVENRLEDFVTAYDMKQLESWTEKKIGGIIFDSAVDDWGKRSSVFCQRVVGKKDVVIVVKDSDNNVFGGYVKSEIDGFNKSIVDSKSFLFSLESLGRLPKQMRFAIRSDKAMKAFLCFDQNSDELFAFGVDGFDIGIKKNGNGESYCFQYMFDYGGLKNALCGRQHPGTFQPTRIVCLQMV